MTRTATQPESGPRFHIPPCHPVPGSWSFLLGTWLVENRRLSDPWASAPHWEGFDTVHTCRPLLGQHGSIRCIEGDERGPSAVLHLFDIAANRWNVYQISPDGLLLPPFKGDTRGGIDTVGRQFRRGEALLVRHQWSGTATESPRWTETLSADDGMTWTTTWTMRFIRVKWPG